MIAIGCKPADEISNYQVPSENRTVSADAPVVSPSTSTPGRQIAQRMLAVIIPNGDRAWFVKAIGPVENIAPIASQFGPFVESITFASPQTPEWTLPEGWAKAPNASSMRFATLKAKDAEVAISFLALNGELDDYLLRNINRWRGQVGLSDTTIDRLPEVSSKLELADGLQATLIDITGKASASGPPMAPFAGGANGTLPPSHPPIENTTAAAPVNSPAGPPLPGGTAAETNSKKDANGWDVPSDWTPGRMSAMRKAAYNVESDGKKAEITVIGLPPSGLVANVNRWRGQIGLENQTEAEVEAAAKKIEVDGTESRMVVLDGGEGKQAIAGVIVPKPGRTWFVKMTGDTEIVLKQVDAFERFSRSLSF